ncbi:MAG TPA: hypothetical protein VGQ53_08480 [Chitinophagaceae bacterium]|jgi:hypothetical protein|nr:hypothetical protein [Chitinophagaceae bacterium]
MERYFILVMLVTLGPVITQKTNGTGANSRDIQQKEKTITTCQRNAKYFGILTSDTKINPQAVVVHKQRIYAATSYGSNAPKNMKNWCKQLQDRPAAQIRGSCIVLCASSYG